jgi:hypothetical protein
MLFDKLVLGKCYRDVHRYMDASAYMLEGAHRMYGHDVGAVRSIATLYGREAGMSALMHVVLDEMESLEKREREVESAFRPPPPVVKPSLEDLIKLRAEVARFGVEFRARLEKAFERIKESPEGMTCWCAYMISWLKEELAGLMRLAQKAPSTEPVLQPLQAVLQSQLLERGLIMLRSDLPSATTP